MKKDLFIKRLDEPMLPKTLKDKRWARVLLRALGFLAALLCPIYSYIMLEYLHFGGLTLLFSFISKRQSAVIFGIMIFFVIYILLTLVLKKLWASSLCLTVLSAVLGIVNHLKFSTTGDFFYPWDLTQTGNVGDLLKFIRPDLSVAAWILIILSFAFFAVAFISKVELPVSAIIRLPVALLAVILISASLSTPKKVTEFLNSFDLYIEDTALQESNYSANGFTGAFTINVLSANVTRPEGYSEENIGEILKDVREKGASDEFASPDIVLILSESFWDPRKINGTTFSENPFENFDRITDIDGVISGKMIQTGFGGGTVRPEFEILTGLTTDYLPSGSVPWRYITEDTESYASVLKNIGYETYAIHPYINRFYDRMRAYPLIGIDNLYFQNELPAISEVEIEYESNYSYISDKTFEKYIEYFLSEDTDAPKFIFGISMENHQAYYNKYENCPMTVECEGLSDESLNTLANFAYGVKHADEALASLVEFIENRDRPTVLVWYGDHLPSLGSNYAAYVESGTIKNVHNKTPGEYMFMQSTPFLVYSNYELPYSSALLDKGKDNIISSYNLMNGVFELVGAPKTALTSFLSEYAGVVPYYNVRLGMKLSDEERTYVEAHRILTYDRISSGNRYSLK